MFWVVWDAQKAALEVDDYRAAIAWAAQTALRDTPARRAGASVIIPQALEDALSRQAQAERERQARVTRSVGESEKQIAQSFADVSRSYSGNSTALHQRAMNMLVEGLKQKGARVMAPSSAADTMNLGGLSGAVALARSVDPAGTKAK
jgi:regulator of protease activity HflC (stomatin/prohibitin superfamily)